VGVEIDGDIEGFGGLARVVVVDLRGEKLQDALRGLGRRCEKRGRLQLGGGGENDFRAHGQASALTRDIGSQAVRRRATNTRIRRAAIHRATVLQPGNYAPASCQRWAAPGDLPNRFRQRERR